MNDSLQLQATLQAKGQLPLSVLVSLLTWACKLLEPSCCRQCSPITLLLVSVSACSCLSYLTVPVSQAKRSGIVPFSPLCTLQLLEVQQHLVLADTLL